MPIEYRVRIEKHKINIHTEKYLGIFLDSQLQ